MFSTRAGIISAPERRLSPTARIFECDLPPHGIDASSVTSVDGTKPTFQPHSDVRWGERTCADIAECLLMTQSGHWDAGSGADCLAFLLAALRQMLISGQGYPLNQ
jgi:hypothetical protein